MIPLNMNIAVNMFATNIPYTVEQGSYDSSGEWAVVEIEDDTFRGRVAQSTEKDSDILSEGEISSGAVVIHTTGFELFFPDANETTEEDKQTIVDFFGELWRVKSSSNRQHDGRHKRYGAVRKMERNETP